MRRKQFVAGACAATAVLGLAVAGPAADLRHHATSPAARVLAAATGAAEPLPEPPLSAASPVPSMTTTSTHPVPSTAPARRAPAPTHARGRVVYLTFDDGPDPRWTPQVLALLARYDAHATFFEIGEEVAKSPAQSRAVLAAGHRIGNHTWDHAWLTKLPIASVRREISRTDAALGFTTTCVRPPGGFVDTAVRREIVAQGKTVELWDGDTRDWSRPGVASIVRAVRAQLAPGTIVLMHDGGGDRSQSVAALAQLLPELAAKGYRFESLPGC